MYKMIARSSFPLSVVLLTATWVALPEAVHAVDFAREVQPIFARRCYKCHGPDAAEGGLRLNSREAALAKLESDEVAIVPGDPRAGVMIARLESDDESLRMPPEGKPLSSDEIARIKAWIQSDAPWAGHWAFRPVQRPDVPSVSDPAWARHPIDAFVRQRLDQAGLAPAKRANPVALLRRAYYDLTGLSPTPAQIQAFLSDDSPDAFEKVVDELLESDLYGEKWARHWLDLVRYAETNGYERDSTKDLIWKYRDYIIRAFNEDKPYDRFITEQLAGDELPDADADSLTATGFYRLGIWDDEPADRELARYDYLDDILRTTGEGFLGMTIGCSRCHDHKIDPLSQQDYYSMLSFFSNITPHGKGQTNHIPITTFADKQAFERRVKEKQTREEAMRTELRSLEATFVAKLRQQRPDVKLDQADPASAPTRQQVVLPDSTKAGQAWTYTEAKPAEDWFEIAFDDGKWKSGLGGFGRKGTPGSVVRTSWHSRDIWMRASFRLEDIPGKIVLNIHHDEDAEVFLNGSRILSVKGYTTAYEEVDVTAAAAEALQTGKNTLAIHCRQTGGGQYIDAGVTVYRVDRLTAAFQKYGAELLGAAGLAKWARLRRELAQSESTQIEMKQVFAMAVAELGEQKTWVLGRGLPALKGEEVSPAFVAVLNPPAATVKRPAGLNSSGKRLTLARWIASPENPLTSRVAVNRVWQHHFGRGIVRTSSDFGFQGAPPTHPDLLDWLASEFVNNGWSLKKLHKRIMMSNTWQMSSAANEQALAADPDNNLFWRFNMRRLTAEELRDSILAVTGKLNFRMFGPPIFPPLSQEVLATASRPNAAWGRSSDDDAVRRSVYIHVKRSLRPPMLASFDAADTDNSCAVRLITTVPTQALGLLNSKFMNEQAGFLAERLRREAGAGLTEQLRLGIRLITGRTPDDEETGREVAFTTKLTDDEMLLSDEALRIWCLMMLNSNEFVYLD